MVRTTYYVLRRLRSLASRIIVGEGIIYRTKSWAESLERERVRESRLSRKKEEKSRERALERKKKTNKQNNGFFSHGRWAVEN